jgi:hypothetical protein
MPKTKGFAELKALLQSRLPTDEAGWQRVVTEEDCLATPDGLICPMCNDDYAFCACLGPYNTQLYEYEERDGILYGRRRRS